MRDLFKSCCRCIESFRQILRVREQKLDLGLQSRLRMQQARIIQNGDRFIEIPLIQFKLRKLN